VGLSLPRSPNFRPAFKRDEKTFRTDAGSDFTSNDLTPFPVRERRTAKTTLRWFLWMSGLRGSASPTIV
jgi:hypothetical protein